jgi:hypothetical protein
VSQAQSQVPSEPARERPFFEYSLPPNVDNPEAGPWIAAGCILLLNVACYVLISLPRFGSSQLCVLLGVVIPCGLLGMGLIAGSAFCRWVMLALAFIGNGILLSMMFLGWPIAYPVQSAIMVGAQAMNLFGWILMLTRHPGVGKSLLGIILVLAASAVAFWCVPMPTW